MRLLASVFLILASSEMAFAQAAAPPPEPPPRLEATGQLSFLDTRGNSTSQSLGAGGEIIWRPNPWVYAGKLIFAQTEADDALTALFGLALAHDPEIMRRTGRFQLDAAFHLGVIEPVEYLFILAGRNLLVVRDLYAAPYRHE